MTIVNVLGKAKEQEHAAGLTGGLTSTAKQLLAMGVLTLEHVTQATTLSPKELGR